MDLLWRASLPISAFHAAATLSLRKQVADKQMIQELAPQVVQIERFLKIHNIKKWTFWNRLIPLAGVHEAAPALAEVVLARLITGSPSAQMVSELADPLRVMTRVTAQLNPNLLKELETRSKPIRTQWEARGPGIIKHITGLTQLDFLAEHATAQLCLPIRGGAGQSFIDNNSFTFETVLTDVESAIPEVLRIAWLTGQLEFDLPRFSELIHPGRIPFIAQIAMVPVALHAGEYVELTTFSEENIHKAIQLWDITLPKDIDGTEIIMQWWNTYQEGKPDFAVALTALDRMIG